MIENNDVTSNRCVVWLCFLKKKTPKATKIITPHPKRMENFKPQKVNIKIYEFDLLDPRQRPLPEAKTPTCMPQAKVILATSPQRNPRVRLAKNITSCSHKLFKNITQNCYMNYYTDWICLVQKSSTKIQKLFLSQVISLLSTPTNRESHKSLCFLVATEKNVLRYAVDSSKQGILLGNLPSCEQVHIPTRLVCLSRWSFRSSRVVGHGFVSWRVVITVANGKENSPIYMDQQQIIILISLYVVEPTQLRMEHHPVRTYKLPLTFQSQQVFRGTAKHLTRISPVKTWDRWRSPPVFLVTWL